MTHIFLVTIRIYVEYCDVVLTALCLVQEDDGIISSADSYRGNRSIQLLYLLGSAYHYVSACT